MNNIKQIWETLGTAWKDLSTEERTKIETVWNMLNEAYGSFSKSLVQRDSNSSLLTALPFIIEDSKYIKLLSDSSASETLLAKKVTALQDINYNIIYTEHLIASGHDFVCSGHEYTNEYESNEKEFSNGIYVLKNEGLVSAVAFWVDDPLAGEYSSSLDYKSLLPGDFDTYE